MKKIAPRINSRADLHQLLEKTININLRSMKERGEYQDYAVKTNIIESNCKIENISLVIPGYQIELRNTQDKFLYMLVLHKADETYVLYLDTFFKRFWKLYNVEESTTIDKFIDLFTNSILKLDSLWMPHQMLNQLEGKYKNVGFSIRFKQEVLNEDELYEDDIAQLSIRLWSKGSKPAKEIVSLLEKNGYPTTKTSTRLLNYEAGEEKFLDEVYYDGKITVSKGTDIEEHIHFVDQIIEHYSNKINEIEANQMYLERDNGGLRPHGSPFEIKFSNIQNIERLAIKLTNSTRPFRIWGLIHEKDNEFIRIAGVDLHTGDKFGIDVMPDYARIYLPKGACGNLILRLYTNIQHSLDPKVKMSDDNGQLF